GRQSRLPGSPGQYGLGAAHAGPPLFRKRPGRARGPPSRRANGRNSAPLSRRLSTAFHAMPVKSMIHRVLIPSARLSSLFVAAALAFGPVGASQAASSTSTEGQSMSTTPRVKLQTSMGDMVIQLDAEKAPKT